jgi:hypothetical protein
VATSKSSRLCWYPLGQDVTVDVGPALIAHVTGIKRCGSPWACPVCSPVVRERRAQEIDAGLGLWLEMGRGALFVTLTTRHHRGDALDGRLAAVATALRVTLTGSPWRRRREALGYVGAIRAVEVTYGVNGWHPHCHAVLLFDRVPNAAEVRDLETWLFGRWGAICERRGFGTITAAHGVDVRPVLRNALGEYLTKVEGGWGAGLELARSDLKTARRSGSMSAVGILRAFVETGEARLLRLWQEYELASAGKRAIVWSPGLRGLLLGNDDEATDAELAAAEGSDVDLLLRAIVGAESWSGHVRAGTTGVLLSRIEEAAASGSGTWSDQEQEAITA